MTTTCQNCKADAQVSLCRRCIAELRFMVNQIPWLWDELLVTRTRQDRVSDDVGKRIRKTNQPINAVNAGAHQLSRDLQDKLQDWVVRLTEGGARQFLPALAVPTGFIGPLRAGWRRLPRGYGGEPPQQARWLAHHANAIAARGDAGEFYDLMVDFVGERSQPTVPTPEAGAHVGRLHQAINRKHRHFIGPCFAVVGRNYQREPIYCRNPLYRVTHQTKVLCPKCEQEVDALENAKRANAERDLQTEEGLLEAMRIHEQPISRNTLYGWLRDERIQVQGYEHLGEIVPAPKRRTDKRLFSVSQAKALRGQDEHRKQRRQATA